MVLLLVLLGVVVVSVAVLCSQVQPPVHAARQVPHPPLLNSLGTQPFTVYRIFEFGDTKDECVCVRIAVYG